MSQPEQPPALDRDTPTSAPDGRTGKAHGDPLLAASEGATEGTEGTRHGADATAATRDEQA